MLNERQNDIIRLLNQESFLSIKELAEKLNFSEMTLRRDVSFLETKGFLRRVFGGVIFQEKQKLGYSNYNFDEEINENIDKKNSIVKEAFKYIKEHDVVFFDSGTTVQLLSEQIPKDFAFTAITSSMSVLKTLTELRNSTVICNGGSYSHTSKVFYGHEAVNSIYRYRANLVFIGAAGYELQMGLTCGYGEDTPLKQAMLESSKTKILLLDSSKFGKINSCSFAKISDFSIVITDDGIPHEYANQIKSDNVELIIVNRTTNY